MYRWVFFLFLSSVVFLHGFQVQCPHGCGQRKHDPKIKEVKKLFHNCVAQILRKTPYWEYGPGIAFSKNEDEYFYIYQAGKNTQDGEFYSWDLKECGDPISYTFDAYDKEAQAMERKFAEYGINLTYHPTTKQYWLKADISSRHGLYNFDFYSSAFRMCPDLKKDVQAIYQCYFDLMDAEIEQQNGRIKIFRDWLKEWSEKYQDENLLVEWDCKCGKDGCVGCDIRRAKEQIQFCNEQKISGKKELSLRFNVIDEAQLKMNAIYHSVYDFCIQNHQNPWSYYQRGLLNFHEGIFDEALEDVVKLIDAYQQPELAETLPPEVYFHKGVIEGEVGLYHNAILSLTQAIEQNPKYKDAYFERAVAYFEMGEFDLALKDYLVQREEIDFSPLDIEGYADFSLGLLVGAKNGVVHASTEFLPSILGSLQGLGNFIWATLEHPIETPKQLASATIEFCKYLRTCEKSELAEILVPEMYELVVDWDNLTPQRRGELTGYSLGKYGTDFLLPIAVLKGATYVKAYHEIKKAEKLCTLETLAKSPENKEILTQTANKWYEQRSAWFSKIEIEMDKQGKHIRGHKNFSETKSEWTHPSPDKKIKEFGGKGQKIRGEAGQAGYQERVDCGEIIGYFVDKNGTERIPTTIATIHYSKKGAHIVPARPQK